uniref:C2H2-type domain-containing protein n=1 Tax=viral metagenome TaxID=1070528 RepID=A0A6C0E367_9ZZZZ
MFSNEKVAICSRMKYYCKKCEYNTSKKCNYDKHILTSKHIKSMNGNDQVAKCSKSSQAVKFECDKCSKEYKDYSGLWRHKKKCSKNYQITNEIISTNDDEPSEKQLIMMLLKENSELLKDNNEFKKMLLDQQTNMLELLKNGTHNTTNNNNTNSHNKTFNLQFFLNETCKDAMNIMDFVESIQLQLSDLEKVGEIGYVDGISNIIVKNLKALDVTQRPLHCTDKKREVLYLKDEDKWEKQGEDNVKLRKVIHKVSSKNINMISEYKEKHPDCSQSDSRYSDEYSNILIESMGGAGDNRLEKESKIIKNISKEVIVEKELMTT